MWVILRQCHRNVSLVLSRFFFPTIRMSRGSLRYKTFTKREHTRSRFDRSGVPPLARRKSRKRRRKHSLKRYWSQLQSIFILIDTSAQVLAEITLPWSGATFVKSLNDSRFFLSRLRLPRPTFYEFIARSRQTKFRSLSFSQSSLSVNDAYASSELRFYLRFSGRARPRFITLRVAWSN